MGSLQGSLGTSLSLGLRLGQTASSMAALLFMCSDLNFSYAFYRFTAFSFLVASTGFMVPWSLILAMMDAYSVFFKPPTLEPDVVVLFSIIDLVLSFTLLAAATSTAATSTYLFHYRLYTKCRRCEHSAAMNGFCWFLTLATSLFNLWLFPSLPNNRNL